MKVHCNHVIDQGGAHFDVRVYSGFFGTLDSGDWGACTSYETSQNSSVMPGAEWVEFDISPLSINISGKTQFRICSSREENNITPLAGGPSAPNFIWDSREFIHWENEVYLKIEWE